jgi:hypothetical protein
MPMTFGGSAALLFYRQMMVGFLRLGAATEKHSLTFLYKRLVARFRARSGAGSGPKTMPGWFHPGSRDSYFVGDQKATLVYASSVKRMASTRPGPFRGIVFFFDRGLMMLIAEASSCVFKCAA